MEGDPWAGFIPPSEGEANRHLPTVQAALHAEDTEVRRQILADGVVRFGPIFVATLRWFALKSVQSAPADEQDPRWRSMFDQAALVMLRWFRGEVLTASAEERERRAAAARQLLADPACPRSWLEPTARAILGLPAGHPQRDLVLVDRAARTLLDDKSADDEEPEDIAGAVRLLLAADLYTLDEVPGLLDTARTSPSAGLPEIVAITAVGSFVVRHLAALERDEPAAAAAWLELCTPLIDDQLARSTPSAGMLLVAGLVAEAQDRPVEAIDRYHAARVGPDADDGQRRTAGLREMPLRLAHSIGGLDMVADFLLGAMPHLVDEYVAALGPAAAREVGRRCARAGWAAVEALVRLDRWPEALAVLDTLKSVRFRHRVALRTSPAGRAVLEAERALYRLVRGVAVDMPEPPDGETDRLVADVDPENRLLEAYRRVRPDLAPALLASPTVAEVAAVLDESEVVVVLGVTRHSTVVAAIVAEDRDHPASTVQLSDWPLKRWGTAVGGDTTTGWAYALGAPESDIDRPSSLDGLLATVEEVLGPILRQVAGPLGGRRVTIVPHGLLHLIPFQGLPSLRDVDVTTSSSLAQFVRSRTAPTRTIGTKALVVTNPTEDLQLSDAEADSVSATLDPLGVVCARLEGSAATEGAVLTALQDTDMLHLSGHGLSDASDPERSALLLAPADPTSVAQIQSWVRQVPEWAEDATGIYRSGPVPDVGLLHERTSLDGTWVDQWIDLGPTTTLFQHVRDGSVRLAGEAWSAGDLLVEDALSHCGLAVLSACESAASGLSADVDEYSGLPAALELADVGTVIATGWPVSEGFAALFVDLFYTELSARRRGSIDIVAAVGTVNRRLRVMSGAEAAALIDELRLRSTNPHVCIRLEAFGRRIGRIDSPFARPWWWAAFSVRGHGQLSWRGTA
ncbi:MAG: CHAT domain-containing protein [Pseudonocardia sp.]|nr:CHAT domain-containing protein [Pseudonocardia sp.]